MTLCKAPCTSHINVAIDCEVHTKPELERLALTTDRCGLLRGSIVESSIKEHNELPDDTPPTLHEASARARFGAVAGPVPLAFRFFASFVSIPAMASTLAKFGLT